MAVVMPRSLCCFAVLVAVTTFTVQCAATTEEPQVLHTETSNTAFRRLPRKSFLAGENMPVWIAYRHDPKKEVSYKRLEKEIVKDAIDYWRSDEFTGLTLPSTAIDQAKKEALLRNLRLSSPFMRFPLSLMNGTEGTKKIVKRGSKRPQRTFHPSVLAVMDYTTMWPKDRVERKKILMERILYALSFFHGVDMHFRALKYPAVRLRVAGIIISANKKAVPYVNEHKAWTGRLEVEEAFPPMYTFWQRTATSNPDFSTDAFDIAVTMTDLTPSMGMMYTTHAVASLGPPCYSSWYKKMSTVLFPDDFAFSGLLVAVHEISHVLGAEHDGKLMGGVEECPYVSSGSVMSPRVTSMTRTWSNCSLKRISKTLRKKGECFATPKEYHPPGEPVDPILPGKLMPASKQCQVRGWEDGIVCWGKMTCDRLYCTNDSWYSFCGDSGAALDGTTCGKGLMCILGKCVSNSTSI